MRAAFRRRALVGVDLAVGGAPRLVFERAQARVDRGHQRVCAHKRACSLPPFLLPYAISSAIPSHPTPPMITDPDITRSNKSIWLARSVVSTERSWANAVLLEDDDASRAAHQIVSARARLETGSMLGGRVRGVQSSLHQPNHTHTHRAWLCFFFFFFFLPFQPGPTPTSISVCVGTLSPARAPSSPCPPIDPSLCQCVFGARGAIFRSSSSPRRSSSFTWQARISFFSRIASVASQTCDACPDPAPLDGWQADTGYDGTVCAIFV